MVISNLKQKIKATRSWHLSSVTLEKGDKAGTSLNCYWEDLWKSLLPEGKTTISPQFQQVVASTAIFSE